jgi:ABC transport system ATP-binding/permease protein
VAISRLGKDVVDLLDVSVSYADRPVLTSVEWRIAPGERTGILGVNGAGKSTLLGLIAGTVPPTTGRVKRGKTVKVASLTQRLDELEGYLDDPVRVVISRLHTTYTFGAGSKAQELTPGQLLERLGFSSAHLSTPVKDLSGGQKRRLQVLLILLDQPNLLLLDEPTNDLDTDMLAALEDLLDSWSGSLIVVTHDRYFMERVTDQQYGIFDGHLRHLPGGVDEYLRLRRAQATRPANATPRGAAAPNGTSRSAAEMRAARKELTATERKLERITERINTIHQQMTEHDQSDYTGVIRLGEELRDAEAEQATLEDRWLGLSELTH